jgi:hypothetical protein
MQAVSQGLVPMNAFVTSINGVSIGAGSQCPTVAQLMSSGIQGINSATLCSALVFSTNAGG